VVMTDKGEFVEVQGTGEEHPFTRKAMDEMLGLAEAGIQRLTVIQKEAIATLNK
jgi:ribonuclease PH